MGSHKHACRCRLEPQTPWLIDSINNFVRRRGGESPGRLQPVLKNDIEVNFVSHIPRGALTGSYYLLAPARTRRIYTNR